MVHDNWEGTVFLELSGGNKFKLERDRGGNEVRVTREREANNVTAMDEWRRKLAEHAQQKTELPQPKVEPICMATMAGKKAPPQPWVVKNLIPNRNVTLLTADGSVGKSLLALQLLASIAIGCEWIGETTLVKGPTIFFTAEDEFVEVWRRTEHICKHENVDIADMKDLHVLPYAGRDAILASFDKKTGKMSKTQAWQDLVDDIQRLRPKVVAVDTLADTFGGNEIERTQARGFISALRGLALKYDMTVIVLAHPSVSGIKDGSGRSGSTGWGNSVRSRILFSRVLTRAEGGELEELDENARTLTLNKTNYAKRGFVIKLSYNEDDDVFVREQSSSDGYAAKAAAEEVEEVKFMELLVEHMRQGRTVSENSRAANYGPSVFQGDGFNKRALAAAMERLFQFNAIRVVADGPASRGKSKIVPAAWQEPEEEKKATAADIALMALEQAIVAHGAERDGHVTVDQWRDAAYNAGITESADTEARKKAFQRARRVLVEGGRIGIDGDYVWQVQVAPP